MKNYEQLLSGIERNETGHIVSAKALHTVWMSMVNFTAVDMDKSGNAGGTADFVRSLDTFIKRLKNFFLIGHRRYP